MHPTVVSQAFEDLLLYRMYRLTSLAGAMVVRLCEGSYGITRREWRILALLHGHDGLPPSALADKVQLDRARTSRAIGALVGKKLITRTPTPADRRGALVALTPAGQSLVAELLPQVQAINGSIMQGLTDAEGAQFHTQLERLQVSAKALHDQMSSALPKAHRHRGQKGKAFL
jgi:DNA-binding MarR family transcriptional regulator